MRIVEILKDFENAGVSFKAGKSFVMAEDVEQQFRNIFGGNMGMSYPVEKMYRPYKGEDLTGKKLMSWRTGGLGDVTWVGTVLQYIKKKYPTCTLKFASACKQSLENMPGIELYDMPFDAQLLNDADWHLQYQGIIEAGSSESKKTHAVDMFFSYFGIDSTHLPAEDKRLKLYYTQAEMDWMSKTFKDMGVKSDDYVIGVQMETSSPLRNYPKEKLKACVDTLAREPNVKIVMIGSGQHDILAQWYKGGNPNIIEATKFSVRESMVLAVRYNLIMAPDSFMIQIAGALDKPLIGLYGPFPSEVRMKYFKNAVGLDPDVACSPCYKHDFRACIRGFPSPCFTQTSVEEVLQAADYLKFKFTGQHFNFMATLLQVPDLSEAEKYMLSADKGLCFYSGYFTHPNIIRVDPNPFVKADITNLSEEFQREAYPFVLYMNEFTQKSQSVYANSRNMVRPGGYFIVHKRDANEQFFTDIKRDVGGTFIILYSKFDPVSRQMLIISQRPF